MKINSTKNVNFSGFAYKVLKPTKEIFQEAAMGAKMPDEYYVFVSKTGMKGDNSMINTLEKAGKIFNKDYFISKKNYNTELNQPINADLLQKAQIEFYPL